MKTMLYILLAIIFLFGTVTIEYKDKLIEFKGIIRKVKELLGWY